MREVLEYCGFAMKDSVPGKYSRRILELMGGVQGCRVLKMPGVRKLLREKAAQRGIGGPNAQQVIADRDPVTKEPSFKNLGIYVGSERTEQVALRDLVDKGVLVPGAALECPKCGEQTWYSVTRIRSRVRCECCGAASATAARLGTRMDIKFKVAPLWRKVDVQYGVIPVILALWRLEEQHGIGSGRYVTSAELDGHGIKMEVDFLGLVEERDRRPMLMAGECKSTRERRPEKLREKIAKLRTWYDAVEERREIKACLTFVTIEREFDPALLAECETLVREDRRVLLMTARELDPYHAYVEADDVPRKHPVRMRDLMINGVARYLPHVWTKQIEGVVKPKYRPVRRRGSSQAIVSDASPELPPRP
jgi:transcription elongation factor Elf1